MRKQRIHLFTVTVKCMLNSICHFFVVPFLNVRDFFFIVLVKRIKLRKDVAEFLVSNIELHKRADVMIRTPYDHKYNTARNRARKRVNYIYGHMLLLLLTL